VSADRATRRRVHLAEDEGGLVEDARLLHLDDQVVALTGALADAGEHGHTAVVLGDALDHLLDQHRLADARTAEQADLAALDVRGEQVDDLDAGLEHLGLRLELVEGRRLAVDRPALGDLQGLALAEVEHLTGHVEHVALGHVADRHRDRRAGVGDLRATDQAVGGLQGDGAHERVAEVLRDLEGHGEGALALPLARHVDLDGERVVDLRDLVRGELDVHDGPDHAGDAAHAGLVGRGVLRVDGGRGHVCLASLVRRGPAAWSCVVLSGGARCAGH
jgi:peptide chain release factor 1